MCKMKFRGKRIDNGEWVEGYYFKTPLTNETGEADNFLPGEPKHQISNENGAVFEVDGTTIDGDGWDKDPIKDQIIDPAYRTAEAFLAEKERRGQ